MTDKQRLLVFGVPFALFALNFLCIMVWSWRISSQFEKVEKRLIATMDARFKTIDERFKELESRFSLFQQRLDSLLSRLEER